MLKQPAKPKFPDFSPPQDAPIVCAQSSITVRPMRSARVVSAFISHKCPRMFDNSRCRAPLALALAARSDRSITRSSVISTNTDLAPTAAIAPGTGASVKPLVSTASPGRTPLARNAICIACPPDAKARQYRAPCQAAYSRSNAMASGSSPGAML